MSRYIKYISALAVSASLVALVACGGGGGGQDTSLKTWGPAESLQVSAGTLDEVADIALNATGQGYAAWVELAADGTSQLVSQRYSDGQWQARTQMASATAAEEFRTIKLAVLPDGQAVAAWVKDTGTAEKLESARTLEHVWVPFATPIQDGTKTIFQTLLASDGVGNAILIWERQFENSNLHQIFATSISKDGFTPVETISAGTSSSENPALAVAANGDAIATWVQANAAGDDNVHVRSYSKGQWTGAASVELSSGIPQNSFAPHAAIGLNGAATVVWSQRVAEGSVNRVAFSTTENLVTGPWTPMIFLENDAFSASQPKVTRDPQEGTTIAWTVSASGGGTTRFDAWGQRLGTAAAPGQKIETRDEGTVIDMQLASDMTGGVVVVWKQNLDASGTAENWQIFSNQFNPATAQWGQAEQLDPGAATGPGDIDVLKFTMDATGRALVLRVHSTDAGVNTLVVNALR